MREIQRRKSSKPDVESGLGEILAGVVVVLPAAHHAVDGGEVAGVIHRRSERGAAVLPGGRRRGRHNTENSNDFFLCSHSGKIKTLFIGQ